ncbi:MarR family transcriptional regulator [Nocardioides sp.]|uniref:MarR family winged helix-turn-helix transcriptional regulator n=1 Tax=Nocardioides sp. TaxID=35761 RepID=UPI001A271C3F|nr:MarR family transcriptional regulator [Nocardioides sp.]MBJ7358133.1 MarR family transcriptional regulator [Nocardioides sp.]
MSDEHPDHVGRILGQWRRERPDLDVSPLGVVGRLHRLADTLNVELRALFAEAGLSDGDFDVLASLRRSGDPYALTPGELAATTMVTSGAVTKRVDRLEAQGYVSRTVSTDDGRSRSIALTDEGRALIDDLFPRHVENERRLLAGLSAEEQADLARLLEKWGRSLG